MTKPRGKKGILPEDTLQKWLAQDGESLPEIWYKMWMIQFFWECKPGVRSGCIWELRTLWLKLF